MSSESLLQRLSVSRRIGDKPIRLGLVLGLAGAILYLTGLGNHSLWGAQEPYVGGIIREMADSGNWVVPTLNGFPYLEKPPLYYLIGAVLVRLVHSFDPWVLRLPSALFAWGTMGWVGWLGCRRHSPAAGWWAAICLGTGELFLRTGHMAIVDMAFTFFVAVGLGCIWLLLEEPEHFDRWANALHLSLGLAFLTKGLLGPVMILLPLAGMAVLPEGRRLLLRLLKPRWGMACGLGLGFGWLVLLYRQGGWPFVEESMVRNTIGRFFQLHRLVPATGMVGEHRENGFFYLTHSPWNMLPWLFPAIPAVCASLGAFRPQARRAADLFLPLALVLDTLFLSISQMRRAVYFLPLAPVIFLLTGRWLESRFRKAEAAAPAKDPKLSWLLGATAAPILLAALSGPWLLVRLYQIAWVWALLSSAVVAFLGLALVAALERSRHRFVLDILFLVWGCCLVWGVWVFPVVKEPSSRRPDASFYVARQVVLDTGADLQEYRLSEQELGLASLIIRKPLPPVRSMEALGDLLAQDGPRVVVASPEARSIAASPRFRGRVLQPDRILSTRQGTPLLVILNGAACQRLPAGLDSGFLSSCRPSDAPKNGAGTRLP
jgi:4-amino-4-deoxy-L-arabinose transferase-like glycosyltransferase